MCRIVGLKDSNNFSYNINTVLSYVRDALEHGDPDDFGVSIFKESGIVLGHRRCSIIDVSRLGNQPFCDPNNFFWVVLLYVRKSITLI
tara:strand:+ start:1643 stop:1906 length:264 start_codon:yes stop_codon:yes gene_type:complete